MPRLTLLLPAIAVIAAIHTPLAQSPNPPTFDVVSIKLNPDGGRNIGNFPRQFRFLADGRHFEMLEGAAVELIRYAYPTTGNVIRGIQDWVTSERYDVRARAITPATVDQRRQLIGTLLSQRFKFKYHYETLEQPVYRLVRARPDGRLNPNLRRTSIDCTAVRAIRARGEVPPTPPRPGPQDCSMGYGGGMVAARGIPMSDLARVISEDAGRLVLDATTLDGDYEFTLEWKPPQVVDSQSNRAALPAALEEQLGLRLQPDRAPIRIIHVDHIERPSSD